MINNYSTCSANINTRKCTNQCKKISWNIKIKDHNHPERKTGQITTQKNPQQLSNSLHHNFKQRCEAVLTNYASSYTLLTSHYILRQLTIMVFTDRIRTMRWNKSNAHQNGLLHHIYCTHFRARSYFLNLWELPVATNNCNMEHAEIHWA